MDNEIKINEKTYVWKDSVKVKDVGIMDAANVFMFIKIYDDYEEKDEIIRIPKPSLVFKHFCEYESEEFVYFNKEKFIVIEDNHKNKYPLKCKKSFDKIIAGMNWNKAVKDNNVQIYLGYDEETKKFKKDYPCLLAFDGYGLILAPRVE